MKRKGVICGLAFALLLFTARAEAPFIDYANLKNPIYAYRDWSIKDSCVAEKGGTFYIYFSAFYFDEGKMRCHLSGVKTGDFRNFSEPLFVWRGQEGDWQGMCSPNISQINDTFYLTYNSWGDDQDKNHPNQLFYAKSKDLENWEKDLPLASNLTAGKRSIDAAIAYHNNKYYLVWKEFQTPMMAVGDTLGPDGWKKLGEVPGGWFENGEFINLDGKWFLLATDKAHLPVLRAIRGEGKTDEDWLNLGPFQRLKIPLEKFNTIEKANCAFLLDRRGQDGFFYLLFSGRNRGFGHEGDKYFKLGISRSRDLVKWESAGRNRK